MSRVWNFGAGPAILPEAVLEQVRDELLDYRGSGMSILEHSHRGKEFDAVHEETIANLRRLLNLSDDHAVLFLQGGASGQFAMIPMNLLGPGRAADYVHTGSWAGKAIAEARKVGTVNLAADVSADRPARIPREAELKWTDGAAYVHLTSNETIEGSQWKTFPRVAAPLVADMSSDILSRPFDARRFALIYAGAQKNLGPSGTAVVIVRKDLVAAAPATLPKFFRYATHVEANSLYNTPATFSIYVILLVTRWLLRTGLETMHRRNVEKAAKLYAAIDGSGGFYRGTAAADCRSDMNVTFRLADETQEDAFVKAASAAGMKGLKGHRSVGGIRASIYNAFPPEGVDALTAFMKDFARAHG